MDFLQDTSIWYAFSFIIFLVIAVKYGKPALLAMLDSRIEEIKNDIKVAENLRVEAQELLAQYQRKQRDAVKEAEALIDAARKNAATHKEQAEAELNLTMKRREEQLEQRLKRMKQDAVEEIQAYATELAVNATTQIIEQKLTDKTSKKLIENSIKNVTSNVA